MKSTNSLVWVSMGMSTLALCTALLNLGKETQQDASMIYAIEQLQQQVYSQQHAASNLGGVGGMSGFEARPLMVASHGPTLAGGLPLATSAITAVSGVVPDTTGSNIGVLGQVASEDTFATGVAASSTATTGISFGLLASAESPDGAAAYLVSMNDADLINSSGNVFEVDSGGNVNAASYTGDGSALTGVTVADGSVTTAKLGPSAVTSDRIQDGTITSADVDGAIYSRKTQLYKVVDPGSLAPYGSDADAVAYCNDANDLPIAVSCIGTTGVSWRSTLYTNWDNETEPAGADCRFNNADGVFKQVSTEMYCLAVD